MALALLDADSDYNRKFIANETNTNEITEEVLYNRYLKQFDSVSNTIFFFILCVLCFFFFSFFVFS